MSLARLNKLPLRARFLLWQLAVLAPLLLTAFVGQIYLLPRLVEPLQEIADEVTQEVMLVKNLQVNLLMAAMPVNDYLIHGHEHAVAQFARHRSRVDEGFEKARAAPFHDPREEQLLQTAWQEWQQARQFADELFRHSDPLGTPLSENHAEEFDHKVARATQMLEKIYSRAQEEIEEAQNESKAAHARTIWITAAAFTSALMISLLIGYSLVHSIIAGLEALGEGAAQIAAGKAAAPIRSYGGHEIDTLVNNFNTMAERVQAHDAALQQLAIHDELTGLENRRAFATRLDEEFKRTERYQHPLTLLMLDIDHFKAVNDTYGHKAGDKVLSQLAQLMVRTIRPVDRAARYGGEEFVILVPETTVGGALVEAERIRASVAESGFAIAPDQTINITVSIGVAAYPADVNNIDDLLEAADQALYRAKRAGRNQVQHYRGGASSHFSPGGQRLREN